MIAIRYSGNTAHLRQIPTYFTHTPMFGHCLVSVVVHILTGRTTDTKNWLFGSLIHRRSQKVPTVHMWTTHVTSACDSNTVTKMSIPHYLWECEVGFPVVTNLTGAQIHSSDISPNSSLGPAFLSLMISFCLIWIRVCWIFTTTISLLMSSLKTTHRFVSSVSFPSNMNRPSPIQERLK